MSEKSLHEIVEWAGSQASLARMLGVSRGAVTLWKHSGIPPERAIQIERLTGGRFKAAKIARQIGSAA